MYCIGFPVDSGDPESSFIIKIKRRANADRHSYKIGQRILSIESLRVGSGAQYVFERVAGDIKRKYRFQFEVISQFEFPEKIEEEEIIDSGDSDGTACALAIHQNDASGADSHLILISCSLSIQDSDRGLVGNLLEKVTNEDSERDKRESEASLERKWQTACNCQAFALVLYEDDANLLGKNIKVVPENLQRDTFGNLLKRNEQERKTYLVSCKVDQLPLLAEALGIDPNPFLSTEDREKRDCQKAWDAVALWSTEHCQDQNILKSNSSRIISIDKAGQYLTLKRILNTEKRAFTHDEEITVDKLLCELPQSSERHWAVFGPSGSGKSTLLKYLAWRISKDGCMLGGKRLLPVIIDLSDWALTKKSLVQYVAASKYVGSDTVTLEHWDSWFNHGEVLLLLDRFEEVRQNEDFIETLKESLRPLSKGNCPVLVAVRTLTYESSLSPEHTVHNFLLQGFLGLAIAPLMRSQVDRYITEFPRINEDDPHSHRLITKVRTSIEVWQLARNPFYLSMMCEIMDTSGKFLETDLTCTEIYKQIMANRLNNPTKFLGIELLSDTKQSILEKIALSLFLQGEREKFLEPSLIAASQNAVLLEGYHTDYGYWANAFLGCFIQSGVLQKNSFSHLSFQEYFVAGALARIVNKDGWEGKIQGSQKTVGNLINEKSWDPNWWNIVKFFSGQLENRKVMSFLELLSDEQKDDCFRHRLALAVMCLTES